MEEDIRCEKAGWCYDHVCPPPQDNTFDFTRLTRQLELNAEVLMERMSEHADKFLEERKGWIGVEDRLPPNDCYVLVAKWHEKEPHPMYFINIAKRMNQVWYDDHNEDELCGKWEKVTYWMPLPDKPSSM